MNSECAATTAPAVSGTATSILGFDEVTDRGLPLGREPQPGYLP